MLKNKNILITGAGKGIGLSILEKCINNSGFVYAVTRSKSDLKKFKSRSIFSLSQQMHTIQIS